MKNLTTRLSKGSLWITATRGLVNLLGLVSTIVLARLLVPADFGLVALGTTMLAIISAITDMSMSQALVHHDNPTNEHMHAAWTLGVARGLLIGGLFAAGGPLAASFYAEPRMVGVMAVLGFSVFLSGCANPRRVMLRRQLIFWQDFTLNVSQKLIGVIVSIVVAYFYRSYWALLLGTVAGQIANVAISYNVMPYSPRLSVKHVRELWSFSMWLTLSQVINTINWRFDQLLIGKFLGRTDLGLYTVGNNFAMLPTREATQPLTGTLFPAFARLAKEPERLSRAYQRAQTLVSAIALPLGVGVALVAYPLVAVTMGEKWLPAALVIQILASVFATQTLGSLAQPLGMALGHTRVLFTRDTQLFFVRLPFIAAGMYLDGLRGILIARSLTGLISMGFNLQIVRSLTGLTYYQQIAANGRVLCSVCAMVGMVAIVQWQWPASLIHGRSHNIELLLVSSVVGALVYIGVSLALWVGMGRPTGPETEFFNGLKMMRSKLARAKT